MSFSLQRLYVYTDSPKMTQRMFLGLYPKFPLPERCFSHNGAIFYFTIFAKVPSVIKPFFADSLSLRLNKLVRLFVHGQTLKPF